MRLFALVLALLALALSCLSLDASLNGPPDDGTALTGVIRSMGSGDPIADARVTLMPSSDVTPDDDPEPQMPPAGAFRSSGAALTNLYVPGHTAVLASVTTAQDGRFAFSDVAPGVYRLVASADGFVPREYGQRADGVYGTPITVRPGETTRDVEIGMLPTGAIQGRLREPDGEPITDVPVYLWRHVYGPDGHRYTSVIGAGITDDRGAYRIFWVAPGDYYLTAGGPEKLGNHRPFYRNYVRPMRNDDYALSFYPGTPEAGDAEIIHIQPRSEQVLDWTLPPRKTFRIRALVRDAETGLVPAHADIEVDFLGLGNETYSVADEQIHYDGHRGVLEISDLVTGLYRINGSASSPRQSSESRYTEGTVLVRVVHADVEGLTLNLVEEFKPVQGRITTTEGATLGSPDDLTVVLYDSDNDRKEFSVDSDGTFTMDFSVDPGSDEIAPDGAYRVSVSGLPKGWYVRAATVNGNDALNAAVTFTESVTLEITLSPDGGSIGGIVTDIQGRLSPGALVVLAPKRMANRVELFRKARADSSGRFQISGIAPGEYAIYGWEALKPNSYFDGAILERFERKSAQVQINTGNRQTVNVTLIPAEEAQ